MKVLSEILAHKLYKKHYEAIEKFERKRIFCGHDMEHFLSVARIATILAYEETLDIAREDIYITAILHDIGRDDQYREGIPHEKASLKIASQIMGDIGLDEMRITMILEAIGHHRNLEEALKSPLSSVIYRADKLSRNCLTCKAESSCDWSANKKNMEIEY